MTSRLMSLLIWAAVAATAVYWGLRLFTRPTPVPGQAVVAGAPAPAAGDLSRLFGTPPAPMVAADAPPPAESRFRLLGVVAPRSARSAGLALISIDGKPARTVAVGRELEPGLRLLTVGHRQAALGVANGAPTIKLDLPALAEPSRGRPGEAAALVPPPVGRPMGAQMGGNEAPGVPTPMRMPTPRLPGLLQGAGLPVPVAPPPLPLVAPESADEGANPATR